MSAATPPIHILLFRPLPAEIAAEAQKLSPQLHFFLRNEVERDPALLAEIDIVYGSFLPAWWSRMPRVRWIQTGHTGVDRLLTAESLHHPAIVTNVHVFAEAIAEQLFGLLLMLTRRLHDAYRQQLAHQWHHIPGTLDVLSGKTLGVLGAGAIGKRAAELGHAFGMRPIGYRRRPEPVAPFQTIYTEERKAEMLSLCDVLLLALPLTPTTRHTLAAPEFAQLKRGAIVLNVGRGALIDTEALVAALSDGTLGGAALDVTDPEPLPADHPLWSLPNVLITPHNSGDYPGASQDAARIFLENLRRYLAGEPLMNVVDRQTGY